MGSRHGGNGSEHAAAIGNLPGEGQYGCACFCGWKVEKVEAPEQGLGALVMHAYEAHGMIARREDLPAFNTKFAQESVKQCMKRARVIEGHLRASPLSGPDGRSAADVDVTEQLVNYLRESSLAMCAVLDLLLEARTGKPFLVPVTPVAAPPQGDDNGPAR
jgi:hypothetical protein